MCVEVYGLCNFAIHIVHDPLSKTFEVALEIISVHLVYILQEFF